MKYPSSATALAALLLAALSSIASSKKQLAFATLSPRRLQIQHPSAALSAATIDEVPSDTTVAEGDGTDPEEALSTRNRLIALSVTLSANSPTGRFISRPSDKVKLQNAINELEASVTVGEREKELLLGDWNLVLTANVPNSDVRRRFNNSGKEKGGWFGQRSGLSLFGSDGKSETPIQKSIRKTIEVMQRIRNDGSGTGEEIDRVDNVIEFTPLDTLSDVIPKESPFSFLSEVNVNPLQVKKSKVVLIHKAEVESVKPVLRTKLAWVSSVLNVAGTSQFFDPEGSDIFGLNNLFGEFLNIGSFDTVYVDNDIRVSRTRGPLFEQLRVFIRSGSTIMDSDLINSIEAELRVEEEVEVAASQAEAEKRANTVTGAAQSIGEAISSIGEDVMNSVQKDVDEVTSALGDAMDSVTASVQDVVEEDLKEIGKAVGDVRKSLDGEGFEIVDAVSNVTKAVSKVPQDVRKVVEDDVLTLSDSVEEAMDTMVKDVQDSVEDDMKKIETSLKDIEDATSGDDN